MSDLVYRLQAFDGVLSHGSGLIGLLHDYDDNSPVDIDVLVASGDCFVTLATVTDELAELPTLPITTARPQLEKLTRTLLYLQRHYKIVRKASDYRQ